MPINVDDLKIVEIDPEDVGGALTVFGLVHGGKPRVTFRCASLTEFRTWTNAIHKLWEENQQHVKQHAYGTSK